MPPPQPPQVWPSPPATLSLQEMAGVVCTWYHGFTTFYHHQHQILARDFCDPPRPKRRKTNELSDSNTTSLGMLRNRGHVTFKPYSDDIESGCGCSSDNDHRRFLFLQLQPNQKRKKPRENDQSGSGANEDNRNSNVRRRLKAGQVRERLLEKKTVEKTTIGNIFPEVLAIIFQYLDVQSKGRAARVSI